MLRDTPGPGECLSCMIFRLFIRAPVVAFRVASAWALRFFSRALCLLFRIAFAHVGWYMGAGRSIYLKASGGEG